MSQRMRLLSVVVIQAGLFWLLQSPALASPPEKANSTGALQINFDELDAGSVPPGWKIDATNLRGKLSPWKVRKDPATKALILDAFPRDDNFGGTFNLCWTDSREILDGEIEVRLRANSGHEDQGGGPMWRVSDADNYYIARYNPLEHNLRVYTVKNGARRMLESASRIKIGAGEWFSIRIVFKGDHIQCFLNGEKLLETHDTTFSEPGGVGLWTKADAATSFDDFLCRPADD